MSNLSKRVKKAKELNFSPIPGVKGGYVTYGSKGDRYEITLSHKMETVNHPDGELEIATFIANCQMTYYYDKSNGLKDKWQWVNSTDSEGNLQRTYKPVEKAMPSLTCDCKGNSKHSTICYHSLGAIYRSFEQAKIKRLVRFFDTYESAKQMSFGGKVCKIESANGPGLAWCVVSDWPESKILSAQENINLMRGDEDEGID